MDRNKALHDLGFRLNSVIHERTDEKGTNHYTVRASYKTQRGSISIYNGPYRQGSAINSPPDLVGVIYSVNSDASLYEAALWNAKRNFSTDCPDVGEVAEGLITEIGSYAPIPKILSDVRAMRREYEGINRLPSDVRDAMAKVLEDY